MIKKSRRELIQQTVEEMCRQDSYTSWRKPDKNTWVIDIDGYVELVAFVQLGGTSLKFALNEKVAQRDVPADKDLIVSARRFFIRCVGIVKMRQYNIREVPPVS